MENNTKVCVRLHMADYDIIRDNEVLLNGQTYRDTFDYSGYDPTFNELISRFVETKPVVWDNAVECICDLSKRYKDRQFGLTIRNISDEGKVDVLLQRYFIQDGNILQTSRELAEARFVFETGRSSMMEDMTRHVRNDIDFQDIGILRVPVHNGCYLQYIDEKGSVHYTDTKRKNAQRSMKVGRFVRQAINAAYMNVDETLMQEIISRVITDIHVEATDLHIGDDVDAFYAAYNSPDCDSCMSSFAEEVADYYSGIRGVSIAYLTDPDGLIVARCLIWEQDDKVVIDRRYGDDNYCHVLLGKLRKHYKNKSVAVRIDSCKASDHFEPGGLLIARKMRFRIGHKTLHPYLDTFAGYNGEYLYVGFDLKSQNGFDPRPRCLECGEPVDTEGECVFVSGEGYFCSEYCANRRGWIRCRNCGDWVPEEDTVCNDRFCNEECANAEGFYKCRECGEWFEVSDAVIRCVVCRIEIPENLLCCEDCIKKQETKQLVLEEAIV